MVVIQKFGKSQDVESNWRSNQIQTNNSKRFGQTIKYFNKKFIVCTQLLDIIYFISHKIIKND